MMKKLLLLLASTLIVSMLGACGQKENKQAKGKQQVITMGSKS
ncbi:hypothetical protein BACCIP111899_02048 [Bacillus rhizoplanae]|uniref:Uncharacterized protein n=1 Tax=Bacillus rhizoplanae TaxID=2880966 RepID=A0ABN7ZZ08_9BACI|nr:hypothetical protein [Bacillus rhizoplanae]CAG9612870.1 hypothetical protein BACCIP111899_02048 [Bacillus rhizoplanae]